ncbi:NAD(P)-dependent oxidoreductase [Cryobacterium sp. Y82]|uniref:NAD-dependent epimerase/dehydratase family protein n=1 Tax=Cryobacterium sp. Y82 TaxID=2045017 RepID=UPI0018EBD464|nr:NAD-dependent epimerase/dehydratase family protein [Cryobacterium sp. Y82]
MKMIDGGLNQLAVAGTVHEIGPHFGIVQDDAPASPVTLYGISKNSLHEALKVQSTIRDFSLQWLRLFYLVGDDKFNNSIFTRIVEAAERGDETVPFTDGKNAFDFLDVTESADQISKAVLQDDVLGVINCCSGAPTRIGVAVEKFIVQSGYEIKLQYGRYPNRLGESSSLYGDASKIRQIMQAWELQLTK